MLAEDTFIEGSRELATRWGRSSVSPFLSEPPNRVVRVAGGGVAGYRCVRHWAVVPTDPAVPPGFEHHALDDLLAEIALDRRRAVFVAVSDPVPYRLIGFHVACLADDASIDLAQFSLAGRRMASLRHSVSSARRHGLRIVPYSTGIANEVSSVSREWLRTKRGGEMGFTLGRFDSEVATSVECRVAIDRSDRVVGFVTWRSYSGGAARVLDLMRRVGDAPNPTMDLLIADSLIEFAASGIETASLGAVPRPRGAVAEWVYPTRTLRRYKDKFAPTWMPLWFACPSVSSMPSALAAVASAYASGSLLQVLRRNA
jgi:phosphatidylglycerol lysyltransferase